MRMAWPRIDRQHLFHVGYERAVGFRRNDPALSAMGLEDVFLVPAQSSSRWRDRQFAVPRPFSPTAAGSSARVPWEVWNKPAQSVWLLSRRQKSVQPPVSPGEEGKHEYRAPDEVEPETDWQQSTCRPWDKVGHEAEEHHQPPPLCPRTAVCRAAAQ